MRKWLTIGALVVLFSALSGCGTMPGAGEGEIDSTPIKQTGEPSYEFESDDIEQAEEAPSAVREYCEGAVSEAQEVGCLSHVEESEVP
jgi:predicted small secreted protein